jgi:hypothetical protein
MMIRASCLHYLTDEEGLGKTIITKSWDQHGKCLAYPSYCDECYSRVIREGDGWALADADQAHKWMDEGFNNEH